MPGPTPRDDGLDWQRQERWEAERVGSDPRVSPPANEDPLDRLRTMGTLLDLALEKE